MHAGLAHLYAGFFFTSGFSRAWMACACEILPMKAIASPTITLYGVVDLGLYYNTVSRHANSLEPAVNETLTGMTSGVQTGSRWRIKTTEQISSEWSVNVALEAGVNAQDGTISQGGLGFGRQSTLSLSNWQFGSLTFGRRCCFRQRGSFASLRAWLHRNHRKLEQIHLFMARFTTEGTA
jgi:hypothetical protein